jgi:serine/threonine-protein kinase
MKPVDFGDFILLELMGHGGMASVYRASRRGSGDIVAVKIFKETEDRTADVVRRLRDREVRMMLAIQHPHVVRFVEAGDFNEKYYYVMEFVDFSLMKLMRAEEPLTLTQRINLLRQTTAGLREIHNQGIVHRDVKPGNILLAPLGDAAEPGDAKYMVKITDLGIAKNVSETDVVTVVSSKKIPGTPKYLSPEQIELKPVDGRADIFSLGVVAYEMLAGRTPFDATTSDEFMKANVEQQARPLHDVNTELPHFLSDIVAKMLQKDRELRYDSDTLERDLTLVEGHLEEGHALLEKTNPNSIFYVPPPPTAGGARPARARRRLIAPASWLAILAVLLVATGLAYQRWPRIPEGSLPQEIPPEIALPQPGSQEALAKGEEALENPKSLWQAHALLAGLDPKDLAVLERRRREKLLDEIESRLATPIVDQVEALLKRDAAGTDRLPEAEACLTFLRRQLPRCGKVEALEERIRARRKLKADRALLKERRAGAAKLLEDAKWQEAIKVWTDLLDKHEEASLADPARAQLAEVLNDWGEALLKDEITPGRIEAYEGVAAAIEKQPWAPEFKNRAPALRLQFAESLDKAGNPLTAQQQYEQIVERWPDSLEARTARLQVLRIRRELQTKPMPSLIFARDLRVKGYAADFWNTSAPKGTDAEVAAQRLSISIKGADAPRRAQHAMWRWAANVGFELRVAIEANLDPLRAAEDFQAGIEITDKNATTLRIYLDRYGYRLEQLSRGSTVGPRAIVAPMAEENLFKKHQLVFKYDYIEEKCEIWIDGKKRRELPVRLDAFKLTLFGSVAGKAQLKAEFGALSCVPVE